MADKAQKRLEARLARHARIRKKVSGTAEMPRFTVRRTLKNIIVQIVDDVNNASLVQVTTASKEFQAKFGEKTKSEQGYELGKVAAEAAKAKGLTGVVFDRGGYIYHGRVEAVARGAREAGLQF